MASPKARTFGCGLLACLFVVAGANHFLSPSPYLQIMPPIFPAPRALVAISGIAEIAGGIGLLVRPKRKLAAWGLILLLVAVFPANVFAARHGMNVSGWQVPAWMLWARLPLQPIFIAWVYFAALKDSKAPR